MFLRNTINGTCSEGTDVHLHLDCRRSKLSHRAGRMECSRCHRGQGGHNPPGESTPILQPVPLSKGFHSWLLSCVNWSSTAQIHPSLQHLYNRAQLFPLDHLCQRSSPAYQTHLTKTRCNLEFGFKANVLQSLLRDTSFKGNFKK